ncbi:uncharacterized protein PHACADRAFT_194030 [Phanerochaete carnosa HHB-10118-sp]|uniref:Uncharacterized protein n=1 Tax=Phanerochaete carnosa (strain HHB-10118-sp) TaxID=650164 RepID=K5VXX4_PHACS|nr:uncharacterized protein PHACADRAFT_194030 [Phanerochaete carnosa HHB-10118-sp]EKM56418.1 hypothetical protein PHACADRAFT_194030 [Phanerochaete carnosa HHB-10118-sp]
MAARFVGNAGWRFELEGTSIIVPCEGPPWQDTTAGTTVIPAGLEQRVNGNGDPDTTSEENRLNIWGTVQLARSGRVSDKLLFNSLRADNGTMFSLKPSRRSEVTLQQMHVGRGTITNMLAAGSCADVGLQDLLCNLNHILQTEYSLETPGLEGCLQHFVQQSKDFGELYGFLRPWWHTDFRDVVQKIAAREDELETIRRDAIRGSSIQNSRIPPRRVWDLRSNRVLRLHALPREAGSDPEDIPSKVWCVSHSWVDEQDRIDVWTKINGEQWPVPTPRKTTLDHVRIELLNMGAESTRMTAHLATKSASSSSTICSPTTSPTTQCSASSL